MLSGENGENEKNQIVDHSVILLILTITSGVVDGGGKGQRALP